MTAGNENNSHSATIDGRTARRDRNRVAVLDAVVELFVEGDLTPSVHDVAERSGVSLRSVYRYFDDIDDLIAAAIDRRIDAARLHFAVPSDVTGSTAERVRRFAERRVALFCDLRAVHRAAVLRSADQKRVCDGVMRCREQLTRQVSVLFAPELQELPAGEAELVARMLDGLTQLETLDVLFSERDFDIDDATRFLVAAIDRLLVGSAGR